MYKILIAGESGYFTECLASELRSSYDSYTCHRGDEASALLESIRPDILIIDLKLPRIDGLTALQSSAYIPPVVLALTSYWNSDIAQAAESVGVGCIVMIPNSVDVILSNLEALINEKLHNKIPSLDA